MPYALVKMARVSVAHLDKFRRPLCSRVSEQRILRCSQTTQACLQSFQAQKFRLPTLPTGMRPRAAYQMAVYALMMRAHTPKKCGRLRAGDL